ncbi:unnamed protein product [Dicrocoelium dendriticum]|nr:unnamed protein product [Dicrocoelium dendriticum]
MHSTFLTVLFLLPLINRIGSVLSVYQLRCVNGFSCDGSRCIDLLRQCDGTFDCSDRTDESNCAPCPPEHIKCTDGLCIARSRLCNGAVDCSLGEDEDPTLCLIEKCPGKFLCRVTMDQCVAQPCSNLTLCEDHSDQAEEVCEMARTVKTHPIRCSGAEFRCRDGQQCIHEMYLCDSHQDCQDGSDEYGCPGNKQHNHLPLASRKGQDDFICQGGSPIPKDWVCDHKADCPMGEDELIGPSTASNCLPYSGTSTESGGALAACPEFTVPCNPVSTMIPRQCISVDKLCDGVYDCPDFMDELVNCVDSCDNQTQFPCRRRPPNSNPMCIPKEAVCDGKPDCPMGDDELEGPRSGCTIPNCAVQNGHCSQVCNPTPSGVVCSCFPGYIKPPGEPRSCIAIGDLAVLYVENGQLFQRSIGSESAMLFRLHIQHIESQHSTSFPLNRRSLVQSNLSSPTSLALDFIRNELFWTDGERGSVEAYHLRTRHRRTVLQSDSLHPVGIAVFEDWVYWTDRKQNRFMRANKFNGRYAEPMFNISSPYIFRLQHDLLRPPLTDRCRGHMCEQLCIPVPLRSYPAYSLPYECACADGWEVNRTDPHRCVGNNTEESFTSWSKIFRHINLESLFSNVTVPPIERTGISKLSTLLIVLVGACLVSIVAARIGRYVYCKTVHRKSVKLALIPSPHVNRGRRKVNPTVSAPDEGDTRRPMV